MVGALMLFDMQTWIENYFRKLAQSGTEGTR
jgi:hypothetical protein